MRGAKCRIVVTKVQHVECEIRDRDSGCECKHVVVCHLVYFCVEVAEASGWIHATVADSIGTAGSACVVGEGIYTRKQFYCSAYSFLNVQVRCNNAKALNRTS